MSQQTTHKTLKQDQRLTIRGRNYFLGTIWETYNTFGERESDPEGYWKSVNAGLKRAKENGHCTVWINAEAVMLTATPQKDRYERVDLEVGEIIAIEDVDGLYEVKAPTPYTSYRNCQIVQI